MGVRLSYLTALVLFTLVASCAPDLSEEARKQAWVDRTLENMSLEEMVSQLFVVDVPSAEAGLEPESYRQILSKTVDFGAGGVVFFQADPLRQAALVHDLQEASRIPLFVAQDMEWGASMRVAHATEFPRNMAIGATENPDIAYDAGRVTATEARAVGVNLVFAPVADVNSRADNRVIGTRSYGDDPPITARFVTKFIAGVQDAGLLATAKHFPGHGSTVEDSHVTTPVIDRRRLQTDSLDLRPFVDAIRAGVGAIMTGHLAVLDSAGAETAPATLSPEIIDDLLRRRLGYDGLVVTDALNMAGVGGIDGDSAAVQSIRAGVDLLLMPPDPDGARRAIIRAVKTGAIRAERIRWSVARILRAKADLGLTRPPENDLSAIRSTLTDPEHRSTAADAARRSIVLLKNDDVLPRIGATDDVLLVSLVDDAASKNAIALGRAIDNVLEGRLVTRTVTTTDWSSSLDAMNREISESSLVILADLTSEYRARPVLIGSVAARLAAGRHATVFLAMGSPYSAAALPESLGAVLVSFGSAEPSIRAISEAVFGLSDVCGRLPISLAPDLPRGTGLCLRQAMPRAGRPEEIGMDSRAFDELDRVMLDAIADSAFPGAAVAVGRGDVLPYLKSFGHFTYDSDRRVETGSVFDLASLTKVIATTTSIMLLYEADSLSLDDAVTDYVPEFGQNGKEDVTIRDLLTHTGGLIPFRPFYQTPGADRKSVLDAIYADSLVSEPGSISSYSDFGPIVLAELISRVMGEPFDVFTRDRIFLPLGMLHTGFRPAGRASDPTIVPTEVDDYFRHRLIQGVVHDENAYLLGGTAGHAGLFSSVEDLARFAHMIVREGRIGDKVFLKPETIRLFTTAVDHSFMHTRALGWDTKSPVGYSSAGHFFGPESFGHTGFTGTSIWFDVDQKLFVILLTNRVYPTRENSKHVDVRPEVADAAFRAIRPVPLPVRQRADGTL